MRPPWIGWSKSRSAASRSPVLRRRPFGRAIVAWCSSVSQGRQGRIFGPHGRGSHRVHTIESIKGVSHCPVELSKNPGKRANHDQPGPIIIHNGLRVVGIYLGPIVPHSQQIAHEPSKKYKIIRARECPFPVPAFDVSLVHKVL